MLSVQHRRSIRSSLTPVLGEEEADALLSELPSKPGDEPVTRDILRAELGELRVEMHEEFRKVYVWGTSALLGGLFGGLTVGMGVAAAIAS
jgi:hypothetical protein